MVKKIRAYLRLPLALLAAYVLAAGVLFTFQKSFIYVPTAGAADPASLGLEDVRVGRLQTKDGETLEFWSSDPAPGNPTIVFFHGNAGNLMHRIPTFRTFRDRGYGFVALDYRGYGNSTGKPTAAALHDDARLLLKTVTDSMHVPASSILLYGESLGTGLATRLASEEDVAGLVLQSPYTSVADAARQGFFWLPVGLLLTETFSNIDYIGQVREPVLIIHGEDDSLFPVGMAQEIASKAPSRVTTAYLAGIGHNDMSALDIGLHLQDFVGLLAAGKSAGE